MRLRRALTFSRVWNVIITMIAFSEIRSPISVVAAAVSSSSSLSSGRRPPTCERITVESCRQIGYNMTSMPNLVGDDTQEEAERQFMTYQSLVQYGCSKKLQLFLCTSYFPMCTDKVPTIEHRLIGPCRGLCQSVRSRCEPTINQFGFSWPPALDCQRFPAANDGQHMCMDGGDTDDNTASPGRATPPGVAKPSTGSRTPMTTKMTPSRDNVIGGCISGSVYVNRTSSCVPICNEDAAYTADEKRFIEVWMVVWVSLCVASTAFALVTCVLKSDRWSSKVPSAVDYKQRAFVNMSFCYAVHTVGYFVRLVAGRHAAACVLETASTRSDSVAIDQTNDQVSATRQLLILLVEDGLRNADCAVIFVIIYYFSTAGWIWWTIGTCRWMIASVKEASTSLAPTDREVATAGSDRSCGGSLDSRVTNGLSSSGNPVIRSTGSDESIGPTHAATWSVAGLLTVIALVMRSVGADELTGVCSIDWRTTPGLLIGPISVSACLSAVFLLVGVTSICRHHHRQRCRSDHCRQFNDISEMSHVAMMPTTQLMSAAPMSPSGSSTSSGGAACCSHPTLWTVYCRSGALSITIILVPVGLLIGCYCYEYVYGGPSLYVTGQEVLASRRPSVLLISIRAVANLVVGTIVGVATVWNSSTPAAWRKAASHLKTVCALRCRIGSSGEDRKVALYQSGHRQCCSGTSNGHKVSQAVETRPLTTFTTATSVTPMSQVDEQPCRYYHHHHHLHHSNRCHHYQPPMQQWERQCDCGRHGNVAETALCDANVKYCTDLGDRKQMKVLMV